MSPNDAAKLIFIAAVSAEPKEAKPKNTYLVEGAEHHDTFLGVLWYAIRVLTMVAFKITCFLGILYLFFRAARWYWF